MHENILSIHFQDKRSIPVARIALEITLHLAILFTEESSVVAL